MSTPDLNPDDPLARALDALRDAPGPVGPSEEVVARTLAALVAADRPDIPVSRRRRLMIASLKIASLAVAAALGLVYLGAPPAGNTLAAFAMTTKILREADGYKCRMTTIDSVMKKPFTTTTYCKASGVMRSEMETGQIMIADLTVGKTLMLDPATKTATLMESKPLERDKSKPFLGPIDEFKQLEASDGEPIGEKEIGGIKARGFRVKKLFTEMTVWVRPDTGMPLLVETTSRLPGREVHVNLSDFVINPVLDNSLFRTDLPAGYKLNALPFKMTFDPAKANDVEDAVIGLIRLYVEKSGGNLPSKIDDPTAFAKYIPKPANPDALPGPESLKIGMVYARFAVSTNELKDGFGYKADGVKYGDASTIIFWFKPKGAKLHRAIYADLHAADVTPDRLPEKPKP